jgi:hypothetical protein
MSHTPAPWKIGHRINLIIGPKGESIANCEFTHSNSKQAIKPTPRECEANALLIATAPDLLEILEILVEQGFYPHASTLAAASAVIAKAKPKSS